MKYIELKSLPVEISSTILGMLQHTQRQWRQLSATGIPYCPLLVLNIAPRIFQTCIFAHSLMTQNTYVSKLILFQSKSYSTITSLTRSITDTFMPKSKKHGMVFNKQVELHMMISFNISPNMDIINATHPAFSNTRSVIFHSHLLLMILA